MDLTDRTLSPTHRAATLEKLKVFGRDPKGSDPIFTREGIETLCKHGFIANDDDVASAREALRCLANALLVVPKTRQIFVDLGFPEKAAKKFESDSADDEFLLARILLMITYGTTQDLQSLVTEQGLEQSIDNAIERHAKRHSDAKSISPMEDMALIETLKLIFNLSHFVAADKKQKAEAEASEKDLEKTEPPVDAKQGLFVKSIPNLFQLLRLRKLPTFPLQPPVSSIINALLGADLLVSNTLAFPAENETIHMERLVEILDKSIDPKFTKIGAPSGEKWDEAGVPLITLFRNILGVAPEGVKTYLKSKLLPCEEERNQPLGKGTTLAARLLQLSAAAAAANTREHISNLLYELSSKSPEEFIQNIGYGYASGFLLSHNFPIPASALGSDAAASSSAASASRPVNPITGQALDAEPRSSDPFAGMSEEEKEREAERLFVLFERLKKTGVVDIKNPVEQAIDEGRFEEIE
ncbi:guanine nucleotide exchange factor [Geopyxis carbonaria]|nr:guanine nucleotide exchange factor [Geopyxis carbonaria]